MSMIPKRPYLLRAFYEWIVANNMTPHILVDARSSQVSVPRQFVKDGTIVLNVSPSAVQNLMMRDEDVSFSARFSGRAFSIYLPMWAVMAIYSRETQDGISFPPDEYADVAEVMQPESVKTTPTLTAVSSIASGQGDDDGDADDEHIEGALDVLDPVTDDVDDNRPEPPPEPPKPPRPRPALRVVK